MSSQLLFVIFAAFVCSLTSWPAYGLSCIPCYNRLEICGPPPSCYETVLGICGCCPVCAKLEGEGCGGTWGELGTCTKGLTCRKSNHVRTGLWTTYGICLGPANAQCTKGEGCREYWSFETGDTVYCCPGRERLVVNGTSGDCICNGTGGNVFSWSEREQFVEGYKLLPPGAWCTIGEGCREHLSCETGGTVHCCPGGERLEVNGTSGVCTCNETGSKEFSCGGGTLGQGYEFLPIKPGAHCTIGEGCREHLSCETGGTVHCCPGGERLEVNGTSGVCTCNETGSKEFSCGGGTLGQGYEFLPIKPGAHCTIGEGCREHLSCETGGTVHCCPGGERLEVNGTSGVCTCNETGSKEFSCGGGTLGQGYEFLPIKPGAHCTLGEGCREHLSCETGGTVHCCPGGERLEVNGTSGVCTCNETGSKEFSCGGGTLGQGYEFLPIKPGAQCTIGEGCREHLSCKTGGTVHCCPWRERLEVNGTSGFCTCNETGSKEFSCGGGTLGQGYEFLPIKPADQDCKENTTCYGESSCSVGNTRYCCPRGHVTTVSRDGDLQSCSCRYDFSGRSCTTSFASPHVTSASALTCVAASLVALLFASFMPDK